MEEKPSYYSIIPANVRYDKNLKPNEKLLYSEITSLCNKSGICYASNKYFAELYEVDIATVSRWVNNLIDNDYLYVNYDKNNQRNLSIDKTTLLTKKSIPIDEKINTLLTKKSSIIINNNNKYNKEEEIQEEETIFDYYQSQLGELNRRQYEEIIEYNLSDDLIKKAIDLTVDSNSKSFNYFKAILRDFKSKGYKCIDDIKTPLKSTSNGFKKANELPTWFNEDIKEEKVDDEELEELEKLFKEVKE